MKDKIILGCGCIVYFQSLTDQITGCDLCDLHIKLFYRMDQLANGKLNEPPPILDIKEETE